VKIIKFGSKLPTTRRNASSQAACSVDDASALSGVSKKRPCDKNVFFTKVSVEIAIKHARRSVIGNLDRTEPTYSPAQLTSNMERELSLLEQGLAKECRHCVDGDGAASAGWMEWSPPICDEVQRLLLEYQSVTPDSDKVDFKVTSDELSGLAARTTGPFRVMCASPGFADPNKMTVMLHLGHQCTECGAINAGDDSHSEVKELTCGTCGEVTKAPRRWLARVNNPLITRAQFSLMTKEIEEREIVKKLNFSDELLLSPIKGCRSNFGDLTFESTVVRAVICINCKSAQPHLTPTVPHRRCSECQNWLPQGCTDFSLAPQTQLHMSLRTTLVVGSPNALQLVMSGYDLSEAQLKCQQNRARIDLFPTSPLVTTDELATAQSVGVPTFQAYHDWKTVKAHVKDIAEVAKLVGKNSDSGGYEALAYLQTRGSATMSIRFAQQSALLRALKDAKLLQFCKAALEGRLLLLEESALAGSSSLGTPATAILMNDLLRVPEQWRTVVPTKLHEDWNEQDQSCRPGYLTIDPRMLDLVNDAAFSMFKRFLPLQFFDALERKHSDIKYRKVSAFGLMVLTFAEDLTPRALTAAANRATYEQTLATVWQHRETAIEFHKRYDENLQRYNKNSELPRFTSTPSGVEENIEYILNMLKKGPLRDMVTSKWDSKKLKATSTSNLESSPTRNLAEFWDVIEHQYKLLESKEARELSRLPSPVDDKSPKRKFEPSGEVMNAILETSDVAPCHFWKRHGNCKYGEGCPYSHAAAKTEHADYTFYEGAKRGNHKGSPGGKGKGGKGGKGPKGQKGSKGSETTAAKFGVQWTGKGPSKMDKTDSSTRTARPCNRCQTYHKGQVGDMCQREPCRFCTTKGFSSVDHDLYHCPRKPEGFMFHHLKNLNEEHLVADRGEPLTKKVKFDPVAHCQINSLTPFQYKQKSRCSRRSAPN